MDRPLIIPVLDNSNRIIKLINLEKLFDTLITQKLQKIFILENLHILVVGGAGYIGQQVDS